MLVVQLQEELTWSVHTYPQPFHETYLCPQTVPRVPEDYGPNILTWRNVLFSDSVGGKHDFLLKEEHSLRIKGEGSQKEDSNNHHTAQGNVERKESCCHFCAFLNAYLSTVE